MKEINYNKSSKMNTEKQIKMSLDLAKQMLGKDEAMDMLIKQNFSDEELGIKPKLPKKWEDIVHLNGYFVSSDSLIKPVNTGIIECHNKNSLPTIKLAEAMLALCQLLYLRDIYNDGWEPNWKNDSRKHIISVVGYELGRCYLTSGQRILSFKTGKLRDKFLENFRDLIEIAKPLL